MKKTLFKQITALFLAGTMLAGVGCKDYDDDINSLNKQLEELTGKVALKTDYTALKGSVDQLLAIDHTAFLAKVDFQTQIAEILKDYAKKTDLTEFLTSDQIKTLITNEGYKKGDELKNLIESLSTDEAEVKNIFKGMVEASDTWAEFPAALRTAIETALNADGYMTGESALSDSQKNQLLEAITGAAAAQGDTFTQSISKWLGSEMGKYMTEYIKGNEFKAAAAAEGLKEVVAQFDNANSTLVEEINKLIDAQLTVNGVAKYITVADLEARFGEYTGTIKELADRVSALEGRIQSMVYVPTTVSETLSNQIAFAGGDFLLVDNVKYPLGLAGSSTKEVVFKVTPASLAAVICADPANITVDVAMVTRAAAVAPAFNVTALEALTDGKIKMTIATDYVFDADSKDLPAIALHVKTTNIDYTTSYYSTEASGEDMTKNIVVAYTDAEGKQVVAGTDEEYNTELLYSNTNEVAFVQANYYYKDDKNTLTLATEKWSNFAGACKVTARSAKATASAHADNYDLKATSMQIKADKVDASLIDDEITSAGEVYALAFGTATPKVLSTLTHKVTVIGENKAVESTKGAVKWTYAVASGAAKYEMEALNLGAGLTYQEYLELKADALDDASQLAEIKVLDSEDKDVTGALAPAIVFTSTPSAAGDTQRINASITNAKIPATGEYKIVAKYTLASKNTATITVPFSITGMPVLDEISLTGDKELGTAGDKTFTLLKNFAASVWANNKTTLSAVFTDETTFTSMLEGLTPVSTAVKGTSLAVNNKDIDITFNAEKQVDAATLKFTEATTGFAVAFKNAAQLTIPTVELNPVKAFFTEGVATINWTIEGSVFTVSNKSLTGAYEKPAAGVVSYALDYADAAAIKAGTIKDGVVPTIGSDNVLVWNQWIGNSIKVKAQLKYGDVVVATNSFTVKLDKDPIVAQITEVAGKHEIVRTKDESKDTFDVAAALNLPINNTAATDIFADDTLAGGLNANLKTALAGEVSYKATCEDFKVGDDFAIDDNGKLTWKNTTAVTLGEAKVVVTVEYKSALLNVTREKTITVIVHD